MTMMDLLCWMDFARRVARLLLADVESVPVGRDRPHPGRGEVFFF